MIKYDPNRHHRRSIRLRTYDYTQAGAYFVTLVTHARECLFGEIVDDEMRLNAQGEIARAEWWQTAVVRPYVVLHDDEFVVMPNHVHGIIWIVGDDYRRGDPTGRPYDAPNNRPHGSTSGRPYDTHPRGPTSGSVGAIIAQYKSIVTKRINEMRGTPGAPVWQRNYYEHIIRDEKDLQRIQQYILNNPANWIRDQENPDFDTTQ